MSVMRREGNCHRFDFANGATLSTNTVDLSEGAGGTILLPVGSAADGFTLQFMAIDDQRKPAALQHADTGMLSTAKTLAIGFNALTAAETLEVSAAKTVQLKLGSAAGAAATIWLYWKS